MVAKPPGLSLSPQHKSRKAGAHGAALVADGNVQHCLGAVGPWCEPPVPMAVSVWGQCCPRRLSCHALTPSLLVRPLLSHCSVGGEETASPTPKMAPASYGPVLLTGWVKSTLKHPALGNVASPAAAVATQSKSKARPCLREAREACALCCHSSAGTRKRQESAASGPWRESKFIS